ncbi:MAG TPA: hypothetical protein HA366_04405 [Candidatus Methanomethylophilaceae archaeon]|nr:hypothetical protein [Candidatus Methanomethylophilaceae archaeon]
MADVCVIGARGTLNDVEEAVRYFRNSSGDGVILDASMIKGDMHIKSAIFHAERAFERGENTSPRLLMEVMLYLSGERQLASAIATMGVKEGCDEFIILTQGLDPERVLRDLELEKDDSILHKKIDDICVKDAMERVAQVDILKR